jgi:hypothetical protein
MVIAKTIGPKLADVLAGAQLRRLVHTASITA